MLNKGITRRGFIGASIKTAAVFTIVPRYALGGAGQTPPSEVITRGTVGCGGMGYGAHVHENKDGPVRQIAVCDVDQNHLNRALQKAGKGCRAFSDFRKVMDIKEIDVIHIATPPHWHALVSIAAAQAGKDVLCEKPMHRFIAEGRAVIENIKKYGRVFQIGTYGRFHHYEHIGNSKQMKKLVQSGMLGKPLVARVTRANNFNWKVGMWSGMINATPMPVPGELNYDMWLGPAPVKPYHPHRVHGSFRGYWDYDGGGLADMGQHYLDPLQYILGKDDTSPVEIETYAPWPTHPDACGAWGRLTLKYEDGDTIILESGEWGIPEPGEHAFLEGPKGKVYAGHRTEPAGLFDQLSRFPDPPELVNFYDDAIKTRRQAGGNAESSHRSACLMHLSNIAMRTGRKLRYDPVKQEFPGDEEANRLVNVPMRAPWHL
ncbi:MAG TPA: Gfo/Idh/MocA family oxidoreductase [Candidatus Brocadiia bacterium]|nr:Gfo/Idh/MocA family oxidoreductase [Candidatus Brocadiia bacterium]